jgi:hypothetical protein
MPVRFRIPATTRRVIRVLFATALLLNGGPPAMSASMAMHADVGQSQHVGHDMADMAMDGASSDQSPADCCSHGATNCHCGCMVQQPAMPQIIVVPRTSENTLAPVAPTVSRHVPSPIATPFRPPA